MPHIQHTFHPFLLAALLLPVTVLSQADTGLSQLDTTVVSASRSERLLKDAPLRTELVSHDEIQRIHARSLKEALENVAGLQLREIHGKSGYEATLQGMSSDQLLILIDGMPLAASTGSTVDLSQYSLADVERIEVIKGAASAQYGSSAMGGVINVISRRSAAGVHAQLTQDVGSYGAQNIDGKKFRAGVRHTQALLEGGGQNLRLRFSADQRDTDGFDADHDNWQRQGDESKRQQVSAGIDWRAEQGHYLRLDLQRFRENDAQWLQPELAGRYPNKYEDIERQRLTLASGVMIGSATLTTKALVERYNSDSHKINLGYPEAFDQRRMELDTQVLSLQFDQALFSHHQLQLGLDYRQEELSQFNDGVAEVGRSGTAKRHSSEFYIQDSYFFAAGDELVAGIRLQKESDFQTYASPKIAFKHPLLTQADTQALLRASVGTGYRVPNLKERYYTFDHSSLGYMVMGNPQLDPESSLSYQLGLWLRSGEQQELDINVFYNDIRDLIQTDTTNYQLQNGIAIYSYENIENARTYGLETVYRNRLTPVFNINLSYTYTRAENTSSNQPLTRRPDHIARLGMDWQVTPALSVSGRLRYQSRESVSSAPAVWSPAWATTDVKINYQANDWLRIFSGVDNLSNRQRNFSTGTDFGPVAGRFVYLGMTLSY